jgi:hypothetical protein
MGSDYRLVSGGFQFIHGFKWVLTTVWYLEDLNLFMVLSFEESLCRTSHRGEIGIDP